jgi:ligand-binding sensor domain-containing protein
LVDTGDELLLATDAGLVVVDKSTLEKTFFNKANSNLSNNHIQTITQASDGSIWIGTYDVVLARFDGTDFEDMTIPEGAALNQNTVLYDLEIAPNGDFWLGTSDGVFHQQDQSWLHYDEEVLGDSFFQAWDIEINSAGEVFVGSFNIHKYAAGVWSNISDMTQLNAYLHADLFFSENGDLYFAGDLERIGRYDGEQWYEYDNGGLNGSEIKGITEDIAGNIYFNSLRDGIFKLENDTWTPYTDEQTEAFNNQTSYFYIDDDNKRWLNSNIYLSVNDNGNVQSTSIAQHSIEYNNVYNIRKGANGQLYFIMSTSTHSIAVLDTDGHWSSLALPPSLTLWPIIGDVLVLADDDIWLAAYNGLHHYDGNSWTWNELEACLSFTMDSQGKIYARANDRIYIVDNGNIIDYNADNTPLSNTIISGIGVDENDNLWIASFSWEGDNAIQKVTPDGSWTTYSGTNHPAIIHPSGDFHFDNDGHVWIPSSQIGAIKFDGISFTNPILEHQDEIINRYVFSIESDAAGQLYFAHQYGVTTFLDGEWGNLSIADVPNNTSSHQSNIQLDNEGSLWWASNRYGVFSYSQASTTATVNGFDTAANFSIYPNPAIDHAMLDFSTQETSTVTIFLYNQLGQRVSSLNLGQFSQGAFQQAIDLSSIPKGIYILQLRMNGRSSSRKIIIQ